MNGKAFHRVALWAAGSFVAGLSLVLPHSINAVASTDAAAEIAKARFTIGACSITLDSNLPQGKADWTAGDKPTFTISAINDSDQDQELTFKVSISAMEMESMLRRTPAMPQEIENQPVSLRVPAGKTATTELTFEKPIPANYITISIDSGNDNRIMGRFNAGAEMNVSRAQNNRNSQMNVNR